MTQIKPGAAAGGRPTPATAVDAMNFRRVLGHFPTGVVVVTAIDADGNPVGLSVGSFTSVSLDPPLVGFLPAKTSSSWPKIASAGRFCVNVLASEQEAICRQFAKSAADKFRDVRWRPAASGAPIIESCLAWIDCDLERVDDAGDHFVVLGRVRELEATAGAVPLIFFQGGYGRLDAGPLVVGGPDTDLGGPLRVVDRARAEMEALATTLQAECVAAALVGQEVVVLASAGPLERRTSGMLIGQRIPAVPPAGATWMAWETSERVETWLSALPDADHRAEVLARLERIRARRYGLSLEGLSLADLGNLVAPGAPQPDADDRSELYRRSFEPPDFSPEQADRVRTVHVPVFGADGRVAVLLNVGGFEAGTAGELDRVVKAALASAESITRLIGGRVPIAGAHTS